MSSRILKITKLPITLITIGILLFGFLCTGMFSKASMNMPVTGMTVMSGHDKACCTLGVAHHIDSWKNIILTVPDKTRDALALLALGLALVLGYSWISLWNRRPSIDLDVGRLRLYERDNPNIILFNHLKLAFARGILNPKIY